MDAQARAWLLLEQLDEAECTPCPHLAHGSCFDCQLRLVTTALRQVERETWEAAAQEAEHSGREMLQDGSGGKTMLIPEKVWAIAANCIRDRLRHRATPVK